MAWYGMKTKKNKFGLSVIKTIAELVMSDTEANFFCGMMRGPKPIGGGIFVATGKLHSQ